jgi:hypothetical protein
LVARPAGGDRKLNLASGARMASAGEYGPLLVAGEDGNAASSSVVQAIALPG